MEQLKKSTYCDAALQSCNKNQQRQLILVKEELK